VFELDYFLLQKAYNQKLLGRLLGEKKVDYEG